MELTDASAPLASSSSKGALPAPWRRALGLFGAAVLGLVLLVAAGAKALDPDSFAEQIRAEGLEIVFSAKTVALIGLGLEVAVGLALLLGMRRLWVLIPSALLVAFFVFLTARGYARSLSGEEPAAAACGCFGNLVQRTPAEAFWQDLLMLVPPLGLAFLGRPRGGRFPAKRFAAVALATGAVVAFGAKAADLPLDDLATRLAPGALTSDICAGVGPEAVCLAALVPGLAKGDTLVVLADLDGAVFTALVPEFNRYAESQAESQAESRAARPLVVVTGSATEVKTSFFWKFGPAFEIHEAPPALLRPLYRRLPRAFEVRDGRVVRTFSTEVEIRSALGGPTSSPSR